MKGGEKNIHGTGKGPEVASKHLKASRPGRSSRAGEARCEMRSAVPAGPQRGNLPLFREQWDFTR